MNDLTLEEWCTKFKSNQIPMNKLQQEMLLNLTMAELQGEDISDVDTTKEYLIISRRAQALGFTLSKPLIILLIFLSPNVASAVMFVSFLYVLNKKHKTLNITNFVTQFSMGFPTKEHLDEMWELQKDSNSKNRLDRINDWL
jgi:hypothetical protein